MKKRNVILLLLCCSLLMACENSLKRKFRNAQSLAKSKKAEDWEKAVEKYEEIVQMKVEARENQGLLYRKLGKYHFNLDHFNDALAYYQKAVAILPVSGEIHYRLAICYSQLSRTTTDEAQKMELTRKAEEEYKVALGFSPEILECYYGLGVIYFWVYKDYYKGIGYMAEVLKRDPKNVDAHFALARFYYELGEPGKSLEFYKALLSLLKDRDPRHEQVKDNIQRILREMQENM
ncbi:MAG: tetratricopeptide repeat protein [bacterium]|nr:tetratricopeptide repeat protein [bacterium]